MSVSRQEIMQDVSQEESKRPQTQQNNTGRQRMMKVPKPQVRVYSNQDEMSNQGVADMNNFFASSNNGDDDEVVISYD